MTAVQMTASSSQAVVRQVVVAVSDISTGSDPNQAATTSTMRKMPAATRATATTRASRRRRIGITASPADVLPV